MISLTGNQAILRSEANEYGDLGGGDSGNATATIVANAAAAREENAAESAAAATAGDSWNWTSSNGSLSEGWQSKLGGELRNHPSLKTIDSLETLAKNYVHTKSMVGRKLEAPGEDASPQQIAEWRKVIGAPESADQYGSLRPEAVPEDLWDAGAESEFRELAHRHNLPPAAVRDIVSYYADEVMGNAQNFQAEEAEFLKSEVYSLKAEWGTEFDANIAAARRVAHTVGLEVDHPAFTDSSVVKAFAQMGKLLSEDKLVQGDSRGISGSVSERLQDITDPGSQSQIARAYRGDFGPEQQATAQTEYHQLLLANK